MGAADTWGVGIGLCFGSKANVIVLSLAHTGSLDLVTIRIGGINMDGKAVSSMMQFVFVLAHGSGLSQVRLQVRLRR